MIRTVKGFGRKIKNLWANHLVIGMLRNGVFWGFIADVLLLCCVFLQVPRPVSLSQTLPGPWTRLKVCPCSSSIPQAKGQGQVTPGTHSGWGIWKMSDCYILREAAGRAPHFHFSTVMFVYGARSNWSWQLKQSCHSLKKRVWKYTRGRIWFTEQFSVGNIEHKQFTRSSFQGGTAQYESDGANDYWWLLSIVHIKPPLSTLWACPAMTD